MVKFTPNKYKYKKVHRFYKKKVCKDIKMSSLRDFTYGLKVLKSGVISSTVLEAARKAIKRKLKKKKLNLKIDAFANLPVTSKSLGIRMGKGSGSIKNWVFLAKEGRIIFKLKGVSLNLAKTALRSASFKIPLKTKFVSNILSKNFDFIK